MLQEVLGLHPKRALQKRTPGRRTSDKLLTTRQLSPASTCPKARDLGKVSTRLSEAATDSLETLSSLLEHPLNNPRVVVAETEVVIQGRKANGSGKIFSFRSIGEL